MLPSVRAVGHTPYQYMMTCRTNYTARECRHSGEADAAHDPRNPAPGDQGWIYVPVRLPTIGHIPARQRTVFEGCCCGNEFAFGPDAAESLEPRAGFELERHDVATPWEERVTAAWLIGPSTHPVSHDAAIAEHPRTEDSASRNAASVTDPVCGMAVDPDDARAKGLHIRYREADYYFCARGCKLDFDENPERYLDSSYVPSM
jgi:YHS domain-containing protein